MSGAAEQLDLLRFPLSGSRLIEASAGTGKTFAYLVPALLAGGKVIISTGTKNLQDQLFQKDLPMVRDALKAPVTVALLVVFAMRLAKTKKFMPAGLMLVVTLITLALRHI